MPQKNSLVGRSILTNGGFVQRFINIRNIVIVNKIQKKIQDVHRLK